MSKKDTPIVRIHQECDNIRKLAHWLKHVMTSSGSASDEGENLDRMVSRIEVALGELAEPQAPERRVLSKQLAPAHPGPGLQRDY